MHKVKFASITQIGETVYAPGDTAVISDELTDEVCSRRLAWDQGYVDEVVEASDAVAPESKPAETPAPATKATKPKKVKA